jgi:hypothetical protein
VIDTLVHRGYVTRSPDTGDRRRITLALTDLGRQVLDAVQRGVDAVDEQLRQRVPAGQVEAMRQALGALAEIKVADAATGAGPSRPAPLLRSFSPIFPVRDVAAALAHYAALGFRTSGYEDGDEYGFAERERTSLHLTHRPGHDPARDGVVAYLYVRDADALFEEWTRPGIGGRTQEPVVMPFRMREGSHIDPDGNRLRFGSFVDE